MSQHEGRPDQDVVEAEDPEAVMRQRVAQAPEGRPAALPEASEAQHREKAAHAALEDAGGPSATDRGPVPGSLRDRMQRRREELARRTTEKFPVPLWDQFVAVELRPIPWQTTEEAITRNQRLPSLAMINTAGDEIVRGTVAFHEIKEDGSTELLEDVGSWRELATKLAGHKLPDGVAERVALVAMCTDQGVMGLNGMYRRWMGGAEVGIDRQLESDF